jgi:hypothetical protein
MKIAIMTIQSVNYGNRLQNYALQTVLEGMGHQVDSLRRSAGFDGPMKYKFRAIKHALGGIKHRNDRMGAFRRFDERSISFSNVTVSKEYVTPGFASEYDAYVIGSDQVWNPDFWFNSELEYLPMVETGRKVAYAASYGISEITSDCERKAELLNGIARVSMREHAGTRIVKELTNREVPIVLDPTMLLSDADWAKIALAPKGIALDEPYAFKYVLGTDVNESAIATLAKVCGLRIIDIMDPSLNIGPAEFIWLIANSSLVCTDSFHASAFALLHHKPLAIYERVGYDIDMSSRFDTLCSSFDLVGHRSSEKFFGPDAIFDTDWVAFEQCLGELRQFSRGWLSDALREVNRG